MRNQLLGVAIVCLMWVCSSEINGNVIIDSQTPILDRLNELEIKTCQKYVNTSNYQQKNDVSVDDFVNSIRRDYDDEILFDVFIRGNQEARIILSETNDYDLMEPLYQIVIGSSGNTFTSIYRNQNDCLEEIYTPDVLWSDEYRKFTIQVTHAGYVRVYVAPFRAPLIEAINLNPIFINYVLFSAIKVDNSSIEYYFDCGSAETIETTETTEIEAPSTTVRLLNTASTHTPTYVLNVIWASLVLQLLIRIR